MWRGTPQRQATTWSPELGRPRGGALEPELAQVTGVLPPITGSSSGTDFIDFRVKRTFTVTLASGSTVYSTSYYNQIEYSGNGP